MQFMRNAMEDYVRSGGTQVHSYLTGVSFGFIQRQNLVEAISPFVTGMGVLLRVFPARFAGLFLLFFDTGLNGHIECEGDMEN